MQQLHCVAEYDEKPIQMEEQLGKVEEEKVGALKENKKEANFKVDETLAPRRLPDRLNPENQTTISNTRVGMNTNDNSIGSSIHESKTELELQLAEKDALLDKLKKVISDYKRKIQELEAELDKCKESETNLFDTLVLQTKQLEQSKISLEESKLDIASLQEKSKALEGTSESQPGFSIKESSNTKGIENETELENKKLNGTKEDDNEELHTVKTKSLPEELSKLKNELKWATEAEENSKKAMDDLAFALKEVATEANQVKAKLTLSQMELEHSKGDAERWRMMLQGSEDKYKELLDATKKESDRFKNTAERLRLEAEESLLAWSGKETEFINCIKRAEEDRLLAQKETIRLLELLKEAENKTKVSKEENQKLRDILKQALNEANVAKEAAAIAKAENSRLQDTLSLLSQENEMLKIHEAASFENIKELKRLLSESSIKEFKIEDREKEKSSTKEGSKEDKESGKKTKQGHNSENKEHSKNLSKTFSLNLKDMIIPHKQQQQQHNKVGNEGANKETEEDTLLRGSIFDEVESSDSESHHDGEIGIPDDFDHLDESHFDDPENERNSRKRRALLKRFGDLLIGRRNYIRKEPSSTEEHLQA